MENTHFVAQMLHTQPGGKTMKYSPPKIVKGRHVREDGTTTIYLQVIIGRIRRMIGLNLFSDDELDDKGFLKGKDRNSDENLIISNALAKATAIFTEYRLKDKTLSADLFVKEYQNYELKSDFIAYAEAKLKARKEEISKGTYAQNEFMIAKLKLIREKIPFYELNTAFLREFNAYMKNDLENVENTRNKTLINMKIYVNAALKEGILSEDPFEGFKMPTVSNRLVFLSQDELKEVIKYYYDTETIASHKHVLSSFLLMCFTSLRVGDCFRVDKEMIHGNTLVFVPQKGKRKGRAIAIPLSEPAKRFIQEAGEKLVVTRAHATCNRILKKIAEKLKIKKHLTNNVARHTFATIFLERGGSLAALNGILDHSDMRHTQIYTHITNEYKAEQISKTFDDFI
jgi:integrase/recombinase XerD